MSALGWDYEHDAILLIALEVLKHQSNQTFYTEHNFNEVIKRCNLPPGYTVHHLKIRRRSITQYHVDPYKKVKTKMGLKTIKRAYELCLTPLAILKDATIDEIQSIKKLRESSYFHNCLYDAKDVFSPGFVFDDDGAAAAGEQLDRTSWTPQQKAVLMIGYRVFIRLSVPRKNVFEMISKECIINDSSIQKDEAACLNQYKNQRKKSYREESKMNDIMKIAYGLKVEDVFISPTLEQKRAMIVVKEDLFSCDDGAAAPKPVSVVETIKHVIVDVEALSRKRITPSSRSTKSIQTLEDDASEGFLLLRKPNQSAGVECWFPFSKRVF